MKIYQLQKNFLHQGTLINHHHFQKYHLRIYYLFQKVLKQQKEVLGDVARRQYSLSRHIKMNLWPYPSAKIHPTLQLKGHYHLNKHKKKKIKKTTSKTITENDAKCLYCEELYSKSIDDWIKCMDCMNWAHNLCAGIEEEDKNVAFVCEFCS